MKKVATVREYLAAVPGKPRATLQKIRRSARAAAPDTVEAISHGIPTLRYRGRMLVSFAAFKDHCSFFPASSPEKPLSTTLVKKMVKARIKEQDARWPED